MALHLITSFLLTLSVSEGPKPDVHYVYEGKNLVGVFKQRESEVLVWEQSKKYGIEEVFVPAKRWEYGGIAGELQEYCPGDIVGDAKYSEALYPLVTLDSYIKCALGVLLFALEDMHNENCYFSYQKEGYLKMGFYDTGAAFVTTDFVREGNRLRTPYNWIGWDFPQVDRPVNKKWLVDLVKKWPEENERARILKKLILKNPKSTPRMWHEAVFPKFKEVEKKLKYFFPNYGSTWILFRLHWYPHKVYEWLPAEKHDEFTIWLDP